MRKSAQKEIRKDPRITNEGNDGEEGASASIARGQDPEILVPGSFMAYEPGAIAAVVIGGTSLSGGSGTILVGRS